jgi:hypothetical protein
MKKPLASAKNFVRRHKVAITVVATATPLILLQMRNAKALNEFLEEHDLLDVYYQPEDE